SVSGPRRCVRRPSSSAPRRRERARPRARSRRRAATGSDTEKSRAPVGFPPALRRPKLGSVALVEGTSTRIGGPMPLSEYEQRVLSQMEQQLRSDPRLVSTFTSEQRYSGRRLALGTLAVLAGLAMLVGGVAASFEIGRAHV